MISPLTSGIDGTLGTRKRWSRKPSSINGSPSGSVMTYCYREVGGARGYTTSIPDVPEGAEIERVVSN